jgi:hypothetical protein
MSKSSKKDEKQKRLAAALKANLQRRKLPEKEKK